MIQAIWHELLHPRRTEACFPSGRFGQVINNNKMRSAYLLNNQLGYAVQSGYLKILVGAVVKSHHNFSAVTCVDSARSVQNGYSVLGSETRARVHETHVSIRQGDRNAGFDKNSASCWNS
jgi:hypothetical protein